MNNGDLAGMQNDLAEEKYPNGEIPVEFYNRIYSWFMDFLDQNSQSNSNIIVVTHSKTIQNNEMEKCNKKG